MKEFKDLLGHVGALLDSDAISLAEASTILGRFIQAEMECSRLTIWILEGEVGARVMRRVGGFDAVANAAISESAVLVEAEFGPYFDALTANGVYASDDAMADERLAAMRSSYLVPHDIGASLDAAIGVNGSTLGVLCCAQQGAPRKWLQSEVRLLKRYADEVALRRARRRAREGKTLTLMQELMQRVVEDTRP